MVMKILKFMQKGLKLLRSSVIQMGPFVKVQIHAESWSQSSTPLPLVLLFFGNAKIAFTVKADEAYHACFHYSKEDRIFIEFFLYMEKSLISHILFDFGRENSNFNLLCSAKQKYYCKKPEGTNKTISEGEGEGEVAFFSAKRWDRRNRADLIESATPCHDAQVVGLYRDSNPLRLTILAAMSEDYTTAPQHLHLHI